MNRTWCQHSVNALPCKAAHYFRSCLFGDITGTGKGTRVIPSLAELFPRRGAGLNYSRILKDGVARDDALKRRNGALRESLGIGPKPKHDTEQPPVEQEVDEKRRE